MYSKIDVIRFLEEYYGSYSEITKIRVNVLIDSEIRALFSEYVINNDSRCTHKQFYTEICNIVYNEFQRWVQENNISQARETTNKLENMIDTLEVYQKIENKEKDQTTKFKKELCERYIIEYRKRNNNEMVDKYTKLLEKLLTDY